MRITKSFLAATAFLAISNNAVQASTLFYGAPWGSDWMPSGWTGFSTWAYAGNNFDWHDIPYGEYGVVNTDSGAASFTHWSPPSTDSPPRSFEESAVANPTYGTLKVSASRIEHRTTRYALAGFKEIINLATDSVGPTAIVDGRLTGQVKQTYDGTITWRTDVEWEEAECFGCRSLFEAKVVTDTDPAGFGTRGDTTYFSFRDGGTENGLIFSWLGRDMDVTLDGERHTFESGGRSVALSIDETSGGRNGDYSVEVETLTPFYLREGALFADISIQSEVGARADEWPFNEINVDFGNTVYTEILLPDGVTFESSTGLFLSEDPTPVPVPAAAWLFASALLGGGFSAARHRQRA